MRDGKHRAVPSSELGADGALDESIHVGVHAAGGLI
jgi:hypothetical protein